MLCTPSLLEKGNWDLEKRYVPTHNCPPFQKPHPQPSIIQGTSTYYSKNCTTSDAEIVQDFMKEVLVSGHVLVARACKSHPDPVHIG